MEFYSCSPAFQRRPGDTHHSLLVIQCDSGHLNADLIACARYRIYDKRTEASLQNKVHRREGQTHMLFIIHLQRHVLGSSFVGFQGEPWISIHIDNLRPTKYNTITLHEAMSMSISHLFYGEDATNKAGREGEVGGEGSTFTDHLKTEMYQHYETEVMQVEGGPPPFKMGLVKMRRCRKGDPGHHNWRWTLQWKETHFTKKLKLMLQNSHLMLPKCLQDIFYQKCEVGLNLKALCHTIPLKL